MPADAVDAAGDFYKVIVENDTVRVLEYRGGPGSKTPMHGHPNAIAYAVTDCKVRFDDPNGESMDIELVAGHGMETPPFEHATTNIGDNEAVVILIEMKG
jgi:hypothetical protein